MGETSVTPSEFIIKRLYFRRPDHSTVAMYISGKCTFLICVTKPSFRQPDVSLSGYTPRVRVTHAVFCDEGGDTLT